jgi:hypothetical protein
MEEIGVPKKKSIILLILLSIVTFGLYCNMWYLKKANEVNNLQTKSKLNTGFPITNLFVFIGIIILSAIMVFFTISTWDGQLKTDISTIPLAFQINLGVIAFLMLLLIIIFLFMAFKSRIILNQALVNKNGKGKISVFLTLIFNFLYLQYEINRIVDDRENDRRTVPWIMFILILLVIIALVVFMMFGGYESVKALFGL